jgi:hypothetical protein
VEGGRTWRDNLIVPLVVAALGGAFAVWLTHAPSAIMRHFRHHSIPSPHIADFLPVHNGGSNRSVGIC